MGQLQDKVLGVSFLKQLECWCNVVRYYPLTTVSIILNLEHLNRMNLKYKKMEQLVFCIVETIVCAESDGSPRCGHVFHVGTLRRFCVDFECA